MIQGIGTIILSLGIFCGIIAGVQAAILLSRFIIVDIGRKWNDVRLPHLIPLLILLSPRTWMPEHYDEEKRNRIETMAKSFRLFTGAAIMLAAIGFVLQHVQT